MSKRNGDRARFNIEHKKRMTRRKRSRDLRKTLAAPPATAEEKPIIKSRLRQSTGDQSADAAAWEVVMPAAQQAGQND